jgi:D-alanyl-D-alanine carboxypeptidase (penicillin-binding protein 5/6)
MRKFLVIIIMFSLLILPITSYAEKEDTGITVSAKAATLIDAQSGRVLYEYNSSQRLPIASITKVMTLLLTYEALENGNISIDEKITASETAASMGGSQAFIDAGYNYGIDELIKSVIIASANDAAVLLGERISGSEDSFVVKMNQRAQELGMTDTTFKNCTGLPEDGHLSSARDVAVMARELLKHEQYFKWGTVWMDKLVHEKDGRYTELVNTNKLIRSLNGCDGLKTGYTAEAGFCVATTAKLNGLRLISVILGADTSEERFADAAKLIKFGFANYESKCVIKDGENIGTVKICNGKNKHCNLRTIEDLSVCVKNDGSDSIEIVKNLPKSINAPIKQGQGIGEIILKLNGTEIRRIKVVSQEVYEKAGFVDRFKEIVLNWI